MVAGTSSSAILAGFLVRPKDQRTGQSYLAKNVTQFFKQNSEKFFEKRTINTGALWVVTVISGLIGALIGYRLGVRIFANPQIELTIKELQNVIDDLKEIKIAKESFRQTRPAINNDDSSYKRETYAKTFKKLVKKYS